MSFLSHILPYKALVIPAAAWLTAQILKTTIQAIREKHINWYYMISAGGMPSAHSTLVCALATTIGVVYGTDSGLFAISVVLAAIVMHDAAGVRQAVDKQSAVISDILLTFPKTHIELEHRMEQLVGHTPFQVSMGALLGVGLALWWV